MVSTFLDVCELSRSYPRGDEEVVALRRVSFSAQRGEFIAIRGPSGSGKSTLLSLLGLLDAPSSGQIILDNQVVPKDEKSLRLLRRTKVGFVFQDFRLLPELTALDNVVVPLLLAGNSLKEAKEKADELLSSVGLKERQSYYPRQLSGGQMQRVAVARAVAVNPSLLIADEPTGNLDTSSADIIIGLFAEASKRGCLVVMATHSERAALGATRQIFLQDGTILADSKFKKESS